MFSTSTKTSKPPKEKKVFYSSRGGAGRSKSAGPAPRNPPPILNSASRVLEVPIPTNRTTTTGRGGGGNARTFVVEEGVFERVLEYETGKIKAMKNADPKRKVINLRGGSMVPKVKDGNDRKDGKESNSNSDKSQTSTRISTEPSEPDDHSSMSIISRLPRVPSFNGNFFFREKAVSTSPVSSSALEGSLALAFASTSSSGGNDPSGSFSEKHCPTCQCWRHTTSPRASQITQATRSSLGVPSPSSPPPSPFRSVFPGVMLYVPDRDEAQGVLPPSSPTSSVYGGYYRENESSSSNYRQPDVNSRY